MSPPAIPASSFLAMFVLCTGPSAQSASAPASRPHRSPHGYSRNVAVLVFDGVELLDCTGPVKAFTESNGVDTPFRVFTVGATRAPVRSKNIVTLVPDYAVADCPRVDILVIPGGEVRALDGHYPLGRLVRERSPGTEVTYSVCNGVFALAEAGFLDGLQATTHRSAIKWLRDAAPKTTVHADRRVVDNGHIVTAAGVSAGIDGALHLVDRLLGRAAALRTAGRMEYAWTPVVPEAPPDDDPIARARGAWYAGDWRSAGREYAALLAAQPQDAVARGRLGWCRALLKDVAAARPLLEQAAREEPQAPLWHQGLGFVGWREGRHADAVTAYTRALELAPESIEIRHMLGGEQFAAGLWRESAANLTTIWRHGRGGDEVLVQIAQARLAFGDRDGALEALEESAGLLHKGLPEALADKRFDPLRDDPRFAKVLAAAQRER